MKFKYFFPEDDETIGDAVEVEAFSPHDAAYRAAEDDYSNRGGWERLRWGDASFTVTVIDSHGNEYKFKAVHEPSVEHHVYPIIAEGSEASD